MFLHHRFCWSSRIVDFETKLFRINFGMRHIGIKRNKLPAVLVEIETLDTMTSPVEPLMISAAPT